jgi:hypothetical protein
MTRFGYFSSCEECGPAGLVRLADGFSCRTQIQAGHLGHEGIHRRSY